MNQQQGQATAGQQQPNVRMIPIFVEGRDTPVINRDLPDSSSSGSIPEMNQMPGGRQEVPRMSPNMHDFANEMPAFSHGSIFDRAKDFPVRRSFPTAQEFFNRGASPSRESPLRQVPINHVNEPAFSPYPPQQQSQFMPSSARRQQQQPSPTQVPFPPNKQPRSRTSSRNSEEPSVQQQEFEPRQVPVHHQQRQSPAPQQQQQQQQQPQQQQPQQEQQQAPPPRASSEEPMPKPLPEGPIEKIQKIQKNVLDLMTKVEQFNGKGTKKDKEYIYLDEMLTQQLLRLDDVETGGKENVKQARKEAVKCINRCLSVLEAKAEATPTPSNSCTQIPEKMETNGVEHTQMDVDPSHNDPPSKQASRGSIYDNHDPNTSTSQSNVPLPRESTPKPDDNLPQRGSKENSPATNKEQTPPAVAPQKSGSGSSQK